MTSQEVKEMSAEEKVEMGRVNLSDMKVKIEQLYHINIYCAHVECNVCPFKSESHIVGLGQDTECMHSMLSTIILKASAYVNTGERVK